MRQIITRLESLIWHKRSDISHYMFTCGMRFWWQMQSLGSAHDQRSGPYWLLVIKIRTFSRSADVSLCFLRNWYISNMLRMSCWEFRDLCEDIVSLFCWVVAYNDGFLSHSFLTICSSLNWVLYINKKQWFIIAWTQHSQLNNLANRNAHM